ncbi:YafY family protein [Arcanobacterium sp. S3PF19]|uniref:helix-turn-helix transcriptional regulator n=1 Tax=Arcanobacterium sp. S3PF19 TaxID=1219585 RepID=UPI00050FCB01|nr:WYL domain-containing protein [Arcanobacterium sp. S3PF19]KGF06354.1 hypothetical protein HMPREF1631_00865 [Arcanobacterium sp. S3PF19]
MTDISISRKLSLLAFLYLHGPVTKRELARHYGRSVREIHDELTQLFCMELTSADGESYLCPIDIIFDAENANPQDVVEIGGLREYGLPKLGLDELITVLSMVDLALNSAAPDELEELRHLRSVLVKSAADAGYADAVWAEPALIGNRGTLQVIAEAIKNRCKITFRYWKSDGYRARSETVRGLPVSLRAAHKTYLGFMRDDGEPRVYRTDRISDVSSLNETVGKKEADGYMRILRKRGCDFGTDYAILRCLPQARWVAETVPAAEVGKETEQELELRIPVAGVSWISVLLLQLGESVKDIGPAALREELGDIYRARILAAERAQEDIR